MNNKLTLFTVGNLLLLVLTVIFFEPLQLAKAQQNIVPTPFLGPIFYDEVRVMKIFDHEYPFFLPTPDPFGFTRHYDGTIHPDDPDYGYNQHTGIDYAVIYKPILASAPGTVSRAEWADASNHRGSYGLHVRINHNNGYISIYGHLSTLTTEFGAEISPDPLNREGIIGISGNTGAILGSCPSVDQDPLCAAHLHFEIRDSLNKPVNPYGWIGNVTQGTIDPWSVYVFPTATTAPGIPTPTPGTPTPFPGGATSHDLWATRPAVSSEQYGTSGPNVSAPPLEDPSLIIDDSSPDFSSGNCWSSDEDYSTAYNGTYHQADVIPSITPTGTPTATPTPHPGICTANWRVEPDAFSPPGAYDIYVHIPDVEQASFDSEYRIHHDGQAHVARVVQAVYPPNPTVTPTSTPQTTPSPWAYIGRYEFAMDGVTVEEIELTNETLLNDGDNKENNVLADAVQLLPAQAFTPPVATLYFSWANNGRIGDFFFKQEDIVIYDALTSTWDVYFDGSDVGLLGVNVDAFTLLEDGSILFSVDSDVQPLGDLEKVDDADIVHFIPTSIGSNTAGSFELYLDGSEYGLDDPGSGPDTDIDVIGFSPEGNLLISTVNDFSGSLLGSFAAEDLAYWDTTGLIPAWTVYFDGSDVGLTTEDENVNGAWIDETGLIFLTTTDSFDVTAISGDGSDIFICDPGSIGSNTTCTYSTPLFWNGSAHGAGYLSDDPPGTLLIVDGIYLPTYTAIQDCGDGPLNCSFEDDFDHWAPSTGSNAEWLISFDAYSGLRSAQIRLYGEPFFQNGDLEGEGFPIYSNTCYQASVYIQGYVHDGLMEVGGYLAWYGNNNQAFSSLFYQDDIPGSWEKLTSVTLTPPIWATHALLTLEAYLIPSYDLSLNDLLLNESWVHFDEVAFVQVSCTE